MSNSDKITPNEGREALRTIMWELHFMGIRPSATVKLDDAITLLCEYFNQEV